MNEQNEPGYSNKINIWNASINYTYVPDEITSFEPLF